MQTILALSDAHVTQLLAYHVEWLQGAGRLGPAAGRWLYALLAALDALLDADTTAVLRDLLRECARIRHALVPLPPPPPPPPPSPFLPRLPSSLL